MPAEGAAPKLPPPFPVVAPPATGRTTPPIPHIAVPSGEVAIEEKPSATAKSGKPKKGKKVLLIGALAAVLVLGGGGYFFVWPMLTAPEPPPPPVAVKPKPAVTTPVANAPAVATKPAAAAPATPVDALNNLAHAPVNAINKAQDAVNARRQGEQARVDAIAAGQEPPDKNAKAPAAATKPAVNASAQLAPGITATTADVEAVAESTPAFRSFIANVKIPSVIGGPNPKITINNRPIRVGEIADAGLGITFEGLDAEKKLIIFKDKTGAIVTKRY